MTTELEPRKMNPVTAQNGMMRIPFGTFTMGATDGGEFERPRHEVSVDTYWIDETLVTNAAFAAFVKATHHKTDAEKVGAAWGYKEGKFQQLAGMNWRTFATNDRQFHPVVLVSWHDAKAYADWAGKRLLTEAEYEKAARGGLNNKLYPWGDDEATPERAQIMQTPSFIPPTASVKHFAPNPYGLYDMCGNVWSWCADWFGEYTEGVAANPQGAENGTTKVRRGASWNIIQTFRLRNANRGAFVPEHFATNVGFRCAKSDNA